MPQWVHCLERDLTTTGPAATTSIFLMLGAQPLLSSGPSSWTDVNKRESDWWSWVTYLCPAEEARKRAGQTLEVESGWWSQVLLLRLGAQETGKRIFSTLPQGLRTLKVRKSSKQSLSVLKVWGRCHPRCHAHVLTSPPLFSPPPSASCPTATMELLWPVTGGAL